MSLFNVIALSLLIGVASALFVPPCSEIGCVDQDNPVCASNGVTYANPCELATAACSDKTIKAVHKGACYAKTTNCATACIEIYSPVCGSDGKTYSNMCYLNLATCQTSGKITMVSKQACGKYATTTPEPTTPKSKKNCPQMCNMMWAPVCGSDGKTYGNMCALNVATCESDGEITMVSKQPCEKPKSTPLPVKATTKKNCGSFCMAVYAPVCGSDGKTYGNACELSIAECESGGKITMVSKQACGKYATTTPEPTTPKSKKNCGSVCMTVYAPVCGSDGKTYSNTCELSIAECESGGKITMVSKQACEKMVKTTPLPVKATTKKNCPKFCTFIWAPVCGSDGKTYGNMCGLNVAKCESDGKITMVSKQPCEKPKSTPLPVQATTKKSCPSVCIALYAPVCGSDGKTYGNSCNLGVANCESDGKITMVSTGRC